MFRKRFLSVLAIATLSAANLPHAHAQTTLPFPDMDDVWYRYAEAVQGLKDREIIAGYPDGTFHPNDPINRAELLKIVFKGHTVTDAQRRCFSDINPDAWYASYVCTAERRGIIKGYPDGTYKPDQTVNFAEAIKIILRAYGREIPEMTGADWYKPYVRELDSNSILSADAYIPWENLTRIRAADLIWRILQYDEERTLFSLSPGCGKAEPQPVTSLNVEGEQRSFLLTVPDQYVSHDPVPLLIAFHGRTNSNEDVRRYYRLDREMTNAIIAYPAGKSNGNGSFNWSDAGDSAKTLRDVEFFDTLVQHLAEQYCIDMDRIFVAGHSLGGWFANSLACIRGDVIRGSASVGSASVITNCSGPAAALIIHNPKDMLAPISGSEVNRDMRIEENACGTNSTPVEPQSLKCVAYDGCTENPVYYCPHELDTDERGVFYPHNWPRGTGAEIAKFFSRL